MIGIAPIYTAYETVELLLFYTPLVGQDRVALSPSMYKIAALTVTLLANMVQTDRIELSTSPLSEELSTNDIRLRVFMAQELGIEPRFSGSKPAVLPLDDS